MKKLTKPFWITIGIAALFFLIMMMVSSVLQLGERLETISPYLAYAFYVVSAILFVLLILRPIVLVLASPTFSMESLFDEDQNARKNFLMYRRVAKNIMDEPYLSDNEREALKASINDPIQLKATLSQVFDQTIKKELNKTIVKHAESVFLSTAISQNGRLDALAVVIINLKLIKELVIRCGFRPSYASLGRLSFSIMSSAVIADSLENVNLNELFPTKGLNLLSDLPFIKTLTGSLAQGVGNALLSLRVGIITRNYLFMNLKGTQKKEIRKMAFGEAITLLPSVLAQSVMKLPDRLKTVFEKVF